MAKEQISGSSCRFADIALFVKGQADKSRTKIAGLLQRHYDVDEKELESLIRMGLLKEYRGIDDRNNGLDFIGVGYRAKLLLDLENLSPSPVYESPEGEAESRLMRIVKKLKAFFSKFCKVPKAYLR